MTLYRRHFCNHFSKHFLTSLVSSCSLRCLASWFVQPIFVRAVAVLIIQICVINSVHIDLICTCYLWATGFLSVKNPWQDIFAPRRFCSGAEIHCKDFCPPKNCTSTNACKFSMAIFQQVEHHVSGLKPVANHSDWFIGIPTKGQKQSPTGKNCEYYLCIFAPLLTLLTLSSANQKCDMRHGCMDQLLKGVPLFLGKKT